VLMSDYGMMELMAEKAFSISPVPSDELIQPASIDIRMGGQANTYEDFNVGPGVALKLEGKSSWARVGLMVHSTAGWIDPGFEGQITLEMKVIGVDAVTVCRGETIAQVSVFLLDHDALRPYGPARGNHYHGQVGATEVCSGQG
jgi:deoxycytidine triphosphate deaminase